MSVAYGKEKIARKSTIAPRIAQFKRQFYYFRQSPLAIAGLGITLFYAMIAILSPLLTRGNPYVLAAMPKYVNYYVPWFQNWRFPLGTTYYGINLFTAVIKAARIDLGVSLAVVLSGATIGVLLGAVAGYRGGILDDVLMRITDVFFSIPFIVLAIASMLVFGASFHHVFGGALTLLVIALIVIWWPTYARLVRGQVLSVRELKYVEAAKASGARAARVIFKHIIPNSIYPVFVQMSLDVGSVVLLLASLDFINVGISGPFTPEWGSLATLFQLQSVPISQAMQYPWTFIVPGMAILMYSLGLNLLGDGLRDILDPRMRR